MLNKESFYEDEKFSKLVQFTKDTIIKLDQELESKKYLYKAVFRNDLEPGGHVMIFEAERRKGRNKNIATLRPQASFLRVEIYWNRNTRKFFNIYDYDNLPNDMISEIDKLYKTIAF